MGARVASVEKALKILDLLANEHQGLRVSDIAKAVSVPYTTAYRLISTLEDAGYIHSIPDTRRYTLSLKILHLYRGLNRRLNLNQVCFPHMLQLMERVGETVHLAVLDDGEVVYVNSVLSPRSPAMYTEVGKRAPVHCTALGKALTAYLPAEAVRSILRRKGMEARTGNTLREPGEFLAELRWVRQRGYAVDNEESELGVRCVASTVVNFLGEVVAAVSVSAPVGRMPLEKIPEVAKRVVETCDAISTHLGASPAQIELYRELAE